MLALKNIVGLLTVLLVAGFVALIAGLITQSKQRADPGFGAAELTLPAGARVAETAASGDKLVLRVTLANGEERLLILDINSGKLLGSVVLKRGP